MKIPSDYTTGYERACALDPEMASNYIAHTVIGDPEADAAIEQLSALDPQEGERFIKAGMDQNDDDLAGAPPALRELFENLKSPPPWVDPSGFMPGIRMFHRNSQLVLGAFVGGTLIEGFSTNISKTFFITGRVRDQGVRRLKQNNRHMVEIFMPGGLKEGGDGWKLSLRIRLIHAQVRRLLNNTAEWDAEAWGTPISAAHMGYAITAFSARLVGHLTRLGAVFTEEERKSFINVWRYSGFLMGIPETILFHDEDDALKMFEIGGVCEPVPGIESVAMAHALVNSAPVVIGITDPSERRKLARYVYTISRALIGADLANQLQYPPSTIFGVLTWFRMQNRFKHITDRIIPKSVSATFTNFTYLLEASAFDEAGISYRLPDQVYAEESSQW